MAGTTGPDGRTRAMRTQARNYRKNPHTATFLQTFHSGISSTAARENARRVLAEALAAGVDGREPQTRAEQGRVAAQGEREFRQAGEDLLNLVPDNKIVDHRTPAQTKFMEDLISQITELDAEAGRIAREYTDGMTERGWWTPGRGGKSSIWIDKMIAKARDLRNAAKSAPTTAPIRHEVADGRYAVEEDGVLKFFRVKNGRKAGFVFLDIQASDDWHSVRNLPRIHEILTLIAQDPKAAMIRYGHELGVCGMCGRTLTDEASRAAGIGPVCASRR